MPPFLSSELFVVSKKKKSPVLYRGLGCHRSLKCNSCLMTLCSRADTFSRARFASSFNQEGSVTFRQTVRRSFLRRYSSKSTSTNVTISDEEADTPSIEDGEGKDLWSFSISIPINLIASRAISMASARVFPSVLMGNYFNFRCLYRDHDCRCIYSHIIHIKCEVIFLILNAF